MGRIEIRIGGFGGQGIMLAGYLLGQSACIYEDKEATQTETYGPEARGGSASTEIVISDSEIDYPKLLLPDIAILMSQPAFLKFHKDLKKDGILIIDSDLVNPSDIKKDTKLCSIPSTQIAQSLGNKIVANVVMLGALIAITGVITKEDMIKSIKTTLPERVLELNLSAFEKGFEAGKQSMNSH